MTYFAIVTAICVAILLDRERRGDRFGRAILKLMASTSFIGCALVAGAWGSTFGRWVLAALALSWVGDACLLSRRKGPFVVGLTGFLLGHLAYSAAFITLGIDHGTTLIAGLIVIAVASGIAFWLVPRLEPGMRLPVVTYVGVISLMVALGGGATGAALQRGVAAPIAALLLVAPCAFYLSDLAVARDRFIKPGLANRVWGLPLYYAAQILFAVGTRLL